MGRPKGSKNKPRTAPPKVKAKAKAKARPPAKAEPPDWLRKAMAVKTPTRPKAGRKPNAVKEKFQATKAKARRGKTMANISKDKPLADPMADPDFRAGALELLPAEEQVKVPEEQRQRMKGTKLTEERETEPAPQFDEVQAGAEIPPENAEMLIAGTLGGSGDHHALARRILERFVEVKWVINKALDEGIGDTRTDKPGGSYRAGQLPWQRQPERPDQDLPGGTRADERKRPRADASIKPDPYKTPDRDNNDPKSAETGKGRSKDDPKGADDGKPSKA